MHVHTDRSSLGIEFHPIYRKTKTEMFIRELGRMESLVAEFSDELWHALADHATVHGREDVRFTFRNGMEIKA
jgi:hypothetical protein